MPDENDNHSGPVDEAIKEIVKNKGATINVDDISRPDGILTQTPVGGQGGVLHRLLTAIVEDKEYRQELKTAFFLSTQEADKVVAAINERKRYGCSLTPIIDWLLARSAGVHGSRVKDILQALSSTTFNTNYSGGSNKNKNDKSRTNSPLN